MAAWTISGVEFAHSLHAVPAKGMAGPFPSERLNAASAAGACPFSATTRTRTEKPGTSSMGGTALLAKAAIVSAR